VTGAATVARAAGEWAMVKRIWARRGAGGTAVTGAATVARSKSGRGMVMLMVA
jgi:hypothetical protein